MKTPTEPWPQQKYLRLSIRLPRCGIKQMILTDSPPNVSKETHVFSTAYYRIGLLGQIRSLITTEHEKILQRLGNIERIVQL